MAEGNSMYGQRYQTEGCPPPYHPCSVSQWVSRVISFSSQYNHTTWSANQVVGAPKVYPQHGDIHGAWATAVCDNRQFIEVEFEEAVRPSSIHIYETYNPGAVVNITAKETNGQWAKVWKADRPVHLRQSRIFSPPIADAVKLIKISQVRIEIDCTCANNWCELDAIQLVGVRSGAVTPVDDTQYVDDMKLLVNNQLHSDVLFNIDDKQVHGHKAILSTRSPFFARLFQNKGGENQAKLKLPDLHYEDVVAVLHFLYTNRLPNDTSLQRLAVLCKASSKIEVPELKTAAMYQMVEKLDCKTVVALFISVQDDPSQDDVKSLCQTYMASHLKEMSKEPSFEKLPQSVLVTVVQEATLSLCLDDNVPT